MRRVEELQKEMQALMDDATEKMRQRHKELMRHVIPKLIAVALMIPLIIWIDRLSDQWVRDYVASEKARLHEKK